MGEGGHNYRYVRAESLSLSLYIYRSTRSNCVRTCLWRACGGCALPSVQEMSLQVHTCIYIYI